MWSASACAKHGTPARWKYERHKHIKLAIASLVTLSPARRRGYTCRSGTPLPCLPPMRCPPPAPLVDRLARQPPAAQPLFKSRKDFLAQPEVYRRFVTDDPLALP